MKKTIYLPDDLGKMLKGQADLNVSAVCQDALQRELSRRNALAGLDRAMKRHVFRAYGAAGSIPGVEFPPGTSREVAFVAKEIAGETRATSQPWTAFLTRRHQIAFWDDNGGLTVFSSFADLRDSELRDSRPNVIAEVARALGEDYVIDLDI